MIWMISAGLLLALALALSYKSRPAVAFGVVIPITWWIPSWSGVEVYGELLTVKAIVGMVLLVTYSFLPKATFPRRLIPCDYAVIGLIVVAIVSDLIHNGFGLMPFARAYIEWFIPYLCGRLAFQQREDLVWAWPVLSIVGLLLAFEAAIEAWFSVNPYEWVFGLRPLEGVSRDAQRWNFKRAYGPCLHPLYFGVLLAWFFAWQIHAAWRAVLNRSSLLWLFPFCLGAIAPLATGSRGPMIAGVIAFIGILFFSLPKLRWGMIATAGAIIILLAVNQERVLSMLDNWSGETDHGRQLKELTIEEKSDKYSSARARLTLFRIYREPLLKAGFVGYGTAAVTGFPINVPIGSDQAEVARDVWSLDNTYMLITLRFGYLGLGCFLAMILLSLWQVIRVFDAERGRSIAWFAACLAGATLSAAWLIFGVWMPMDFGYPFLWGIGATSGLYYQTFINSADQKLERLRER